MAATWSPIGGGPRSRRSVQALTEGVPSAADDGVLLVDVGSVKLFAHAPVGQTFTGVGSLLAYVYTNGSWVRDANADIDMAYVTGLQDGAIGPALTVASPRDRIAFIASGVTLSGAGTQITIDVMCVTKLNAGLAA